MFEIVLEKLSNIPDKFWQRLFIVFLAYVAAQIAIRVLPIPFLADDSFLMAIFAIITLIGIYLIPKILSSPFLSYIIVQLMFFWMVLDLFLLRTVHVFVKSHVIIFGVALLAGIIYFFKNFNYLWKFIPIRFFLIFFVINIFYYLFYSSNFNINLIHLSGYGGTSENQAAKTVVFLDSLAVLVSSIIPLSLLAKIKDEAELNSIVYKISKIFSYCFILLAVLFPFLKGTLAHGTNIFLSMYFLLILGLKYYIDNTEAKEYITARFSNLMTFTIIVLFGLAIIKCNKSSLIAVLASMSVFILVNYTLKLKFYVPEVFTNKNWGALFSCLSIGLLIFIAAQLGILEVIQNKLKAAFDSIFGGGITSLYIRKNNWGLLSNYWREHLDAFNSLFGFGLGKSREIMYYLSKSQYSPIFLVQTTHNQFTEMFFDYGAVALLYYIPLMMIFFRNISNLISRQINKNIKLISNISLCLIIFYLIYHYADGMRVPTAIMFFSSIMLLEGLKFNLAKFNITNNQVNNEI